MSTKAKCCVERNKIPFVMYSAETAKNTIRKLLKTHLYKMDFFTAVPGSGWMVSVVFGFVALRQTLVTVRDLKWLFSGGVDSAERIKRYLQNQVPGCFGQCRCLIGSGVIK